jgi:hypothetical protein
MNTKGQWIVVVFANGPDVVVRPQYKLDNNPIGTYRSNLQSYCRTEKQIEFAKARWQRWCDQENIKEKQAQQLAEQYS